MALFGRGRQPKTGHDTVLSLIEQVAELRATVRGIEAEWDDIRAQIRKGYQRMERAEQRFASRMNGAKQEPVEPTEAESAHPAGSFAKKWAQIQPAGKE